MDRKNPITFEVIPVVSLFSLESQDCEAIQSHFCIWGAGASHKLYRLRDDQESGFPEDVHCAISWLFKHIPPEHKAVIVLLE
jgi:hypothetical protein